MDDRETLNELRRLDELQAKAGGTAIAAPSSAPDQPASTMDKLIGGKGGRFLLGAASPLLASAQLGAHVGDKINEWTGTPQVVSPWLDAQLKALDAAKQRGMQAHGTEGLDIYGLLGALAPGAAIAKGVTASLPQAANALGRMGTGAAVGGATAAAQPISSPDFFTDKAKQAGIGAAIGGAIPAIGEALKSLRGAPQLNPVAAQTLQEGQQAGYVVPASTVNPSFLNHRLESIAGKAAVGQEAAKRNQEITNALANQALGLPKDTNLTEGVLKTARAVAGKPYAEIAKLSPEADDALEALKQARFMGNKYAVFSDRSGDPAAYLKAEELKKTAGMIEQQLANLATQHGRPDLVQQLPAARTAIAKTYDVERALNLGDSNVTAAIIGRKFDKVGEKGLTGPLQTIGKMAQAFPSIMREGGRVPTPGVSGTDAAAGALLGTLGYGAGGATGALAAGLPLLRGPVRSLVLSPGYQRMATADPSHYRALIDALTRQGSAVAGTTTGRTLGGYE